MSIDAAELRRQKILKNSELRLQLLMGIKNAESQIKSGENIEAKKPSQEILSNDVISNQTCNLIHDTPNLIHRQPESNYLSSEEKSLADDTSQNENLLNTEIKTDLTEQKDLVYRFNGYSNLEVLILFSLAMLTSALFYFEISDLIYHNVILPFFTFEIGHLVIHLKYFPGTSSQFQLFRTLLQLCGISQRSLKKLMVALNFIFILIDNFVIYILSFVLINLILNSFFIMA